MEKITYTELAEMKTEVNQCEDDILNDMLTARITAFIYAKTKDIEVVRYSERPTFMDWLLRRKKKVVVNIKVKDLLLNPPKNNELRIYVTE